MNNTSKTILFEEFTGEKPSIMAEIKNLGNGSNIDEVYEAIAGTKNGRQVEDETKGYIVKSFDEFLKKFNPVIYETQSYDEFYERPIVTYSLKQTKNSKPVEICKQAFYEVVCDVINKKAVSGKTNIDFDYGLISELLSPRAETKRMKRIRQELKLNTEKFLECKKNNRSEEAIKYLKICSKNYQEIWKRYKDNPINLLPLAIADTDVMIKEIRKHTEQNNTSSEVITGSEQLRICDYTYNEDGELKAVYCENAIEEEDNDSSMDDNIITTTGVLKKNIDRVIEQIPSIKDSKYMCNVFERSFVLNSITANEDLDNLLERQKGYVEAYVSVQQSFFDAAAELIKKVLNVEMFFKHASDEKGEFHSELIITNCGIDEILEENNKKCFKDFIERLNNTSDKKIWFAILPPVYNKDYAEDTQTMEFNSDDEYDMTGRMAEDKTAVTEDKVKIESITQMVDILKDENIISFFNFKASEKTSFKNFSENIFEGYKSEIDNINNTVKDFSVLSYPNFTVIPKEEKDILVSDELIKEDGTVCLGKKYVKIPAIYIDSAYVSAGLVAATQSIDILRQKGYKIVEDNPCVRFNLEDSKNKFNFKTIFNREDGFTRAEGLTEKIERCKLGFCYSSNEAYDETNNEIKNAYLQTARTCSGKLLYKKLVWIYVVSHIKCKNNWEVSGTISKFSKETDELYKYCKGQQQTEGKAVNRLLYGENEEIRYDNGQIVIKFGADEELIRVDIKEE